MKIALVNCVTLPEPDPDEAPLLAALRDGGHVANSEAWDNPGVAWDSYDAAVLRATWNYHTRPDAFLGWLDQVSKQTRVLNNAEAVRWNIHKRYLKHFEDRRIPIVPTLWGTKDPAPGGDLITDALKRGWTKLVVKPSVSAGSRDTRVFEVAHGMTNEDAASFARSLRSREDMMVQQYMTAVESGAEVSLVIIAGRVSHAIVKHPRFAGQSERVEAKASIPEDERRFAEAVLEACPFDTLYARVDMMRNQHGGIVLSELELIEPSLFFSHAPGSAERMSRAIEAKLAEPIA